jgi:hypothetical protein
MGRACSVHGEKMSAYRILVDNPEGKRPLGRPTHKRDDIREPGWRDMELTYLAQDK